MEKKFDDTPEVAPQNFPEVAGQQQPAEYGFPQYQAGTSPITAQSPHSGFRPVDGSTVYGGQSPYQQYAQPLPPAEKKKEGRKVCGCALLVFILSCIIAVLSAAVIGLVASTVVEANRANDYQSRYENATRTTSSTATSSPTATSTPFNSLTNGCTDNPDGVTNTNYTSFQLLGPDRYTMYCNRDTPNPPLMGVFAADFSTCMDTCSSWTKYVKDAMTNDTSNNNVTCAAVSFIPLWTDKSRALTGGAPGNCYLKAGPQNETGLLIKNIGTEVHAAVLDPTFNSEA